MHRCIVCGKPITWTFAICAGCEKTYGNKAREWPTWLSFLWNAEQRERRRNKQIHNHEITMADMADGDGYEFEPTF
jgi:hypothetical protein